MKRSIVLGLLLAFGALSLTVAGYQGQARKRAKVPDIYKVKDNLYVIGGSQPELQDEFTGGNTAVWITGKGVVVVDSKNPTWGQTIVEKIKSVTDKPIIMVLNSHGHNDHSGSNVELPPTAEYIVHENIRAMWAKDKCAPVANCQSFKGENAKYLPKRTFKDKMTVLEGKDRIDLYWFGRGHTNGDTWIVFPAARAMHVGDLYRPRVAPFMDVENGGSGVEFPATLAKGVAGISNVDSVIPGHGPVMTFDDMKAHRDFMQDFVDQVRAGVKAGKSASQIVAAYQIPAKFKGYHEALQADRSRIKEDLEIVYNELTKK
jgi:glyoxylase-like metal-dependent hydrolase (beta-lactamase superfamily II)